MFQIETGRKGFDVIMFHTETSISENPCSMFQLETNDKDYGRGHALYEVEALGITLAHLGSRRRVSGHV